MSTPNLKYLEAQMLGKAEGEDKQFRELSSKAWHNSYHVLRYFAMAANIPSTRKFIQTQKKASNNRDLWTKLALEDPLVDDSLRPAIQAIQAHRKSQFPKSSEATTQLAQSVKPLYDHLVDRKGVKMKEARDMILRCLQQMFPFERSLDSYTDDTFKKALDRCK